MPLGAPSFHTVDYTHTSSGPNSQIDTEGERCVFLEQRHGLTDVSSIWDVRLLWKFEVLRSGVAHYL